ncbi:LysR family transcriptional regulator [Sphingomonas pokkalii]|uniref:LysR family transcriptional regulator n=1 Tax=Sphingomonas pokkalii TaxID=2175090 RepID=A0A2U0SG46_9SPHN|nr:LysR family transcriptional regulator [Sphingomonas pokkalii]PVX30360.1 LysR family transcriptional regulator [Sphingomonas pokkalii]
MNWDDLRIFLAVARAQRLSRAAATLEMDATTVSRRLRKLETTLALRLFEHAPTGHMLTEDGQRLLDQVERMEAEALDIAGTQPNGMGLAGTLRVSASEGFGTRIIAPRLQGFTSRFPNIQIDLIASSGFLSPSRREVDVAVMLARPRAGPLVASKLTDYALGLYATRAYLAAAPPLRQPADLLGHRMTGYVGDQIYAPELRYLAEIDRRLAPQVRSTSINAQAEMIAGGHVCGILPCFIGDAMPGLERLLRDTIDIQRSFWLVVPRDLRGLPRIDRFLGWLVEEMQPLRHAMHGTSQTPAAPSRRVLPRSIPGDSEST